MFRLLLALIFFSPFSDIYAQVEGKIFGKWKTIDDKTNKAKSIVEIFEKEGKAYGRIIKLFREPGEDPDPLCEECEDDKHNKKIIGMEILEDMKKSGDVWERGTILDPENGNIYRCSIWVEDGNLKVRGYILFFYRTQTWIKEN